MMIAPFSISPPSGGQKRGAKCRYTKVTSAAAEGADLDADAVAMQEAQQKFFSSSTSEL